MDRRRYHHRDLPAALVRAAIDLVDKGGPAAVTLAEAARRVGVSGSAPYRHFTDREALLAVSAVDAFDRLTGSLESAAASESRPVDRLAAMAAAYVRFSHEQPGRFALLFGAGIDKGGHPELLAAAGRAFDTVLSTTREVCPDDDEKAEQLALRVWAVAHGHAALLADGALADHGLDTATATAAAVAVTLAVADDRGISPR